MRPRSELQSVILYNRKDEDGNWVPMKVEANSWVTLMPGKTGGHTKDAKKHGGHDIDGCYKAKVLKFRARSNSVAAVYVQHAYQWRQLQDLDPDTRRATQAACNYLFPSHFQEWVDPKCILGFIVVMHAEIGELTRGSRSHKDLLQDGVFFFNAEYFPRTSGSGFGHLQPIPLPKFDLVDWPLPDMSTSESFRAKLRHDFQSAMKPSTGSKQTHISWFMPIGVFIDLFATASEFHRTTSMWVLKHVQEPLCQSLMDGGWNSKITIGADVIRCTVHQESLVFRYHIARSTLYARFCYNRERMLQNLQWETIDQNELVQLVAVHCELGELHQVLEVGSTWTLSDIRLEISIQFGMNLDADFDMYIVIGDSVVKVNARNENKTNVIDVLPPKKLRIILRV